MNQLTQIIKALQETVRKPKACCAILSSGCVDESSLMGTQQGLLNLALALLQIVDACERQSSQLVELDRLADKNAYWSDNLKKTLHQLPGSHPFLVGCYVFDDHKSFVTALEESVNSSLTDGSKLRNDPAFTEP